MVLLNRVRGTIDWWDPELLDLSADHDVIVFDNIGTGYSQRARQESGGALPIYVVVTMHHDALAGSD